MINKKALAMFLGITFGLTISLALIARLGGWTLFGVPQILSQLVLVVAMFIPAISAIIIQVFYLKRSWRELGFRLGPWQLYLKVYLGIILMYVVNYAVTWIFVIGPDFTLISFMQQFGNTLVLPFSSLKMITIMGLVTFIIAPLVNLIPSMGEELGWRGFLLPQLEPLGKGRAMIYSAMIWALWHSPLIVILGFGYGADYLQGVILHFVTITGFGIWVAYIWFKTRSTILTSFMHATFNANAYGVWILLFVGQGPLLVGPIGLIGASISCLVGLIGIYIYKKNK